MKIVLFFQSESFAIMHAEGFKHTHYEQSNYKNKQNTDEGYEYSISHPVLYNTKQKLS